MPSGELLGWFLAGSIIVPMLVWGVLDFVIWKRGEQTFSQWVMQESTKRLSFAIAAFAFCLIIIGLGVWLVFHWELPHIVFSHM